MLRARLAVPVAVFVLSVIAAAVPSITSAAGDTVPVGIHDGGDISTWGYNPNPTTITVGQTVTFTNTGTSAHDAVADDGSWKTPLLQSGASASVTFSTPGNFTYNCPLHPWMKGSLIVTPAASAPAPAPVDVSAPAPAPAPVDAAPAISPAPQPDATAGQADNTAVTDTGDGSGN
jgi:plastocyanin